MLLFAITVYHHSNIIFLDSLSLYDLCIKHVNTAHSDIYNDKHVPMMASMRGVLEDLSQSEIRTSSSTKSVLKTAMTYTSSVVRTCMLEYVIALISVP